MKNLLILLLMLLPVAAFCGDKKGPKPFRGRWKETKRMLPDSTTITYTDTLFISFRAKDTFSYHYPNGFIYNGAYTLSEDSILDFGTIKFRLLLFKPGKTMVLVNSEGIYQFGVDSSDTVKAIVIAKEEKALPVTDIDQMIGHWTVYKKTAVGNADPPSVDIQIRSAYITGASTDGTLGFLYGGNDADSQPSWFIKNFTDGQVLECGGKGSRSFKVIKCQKGELIIEDETMRYFFKQFK